MRNILELILKFILIPIGVVSGILFGIAFENKELLLQVFIAIGTVGAVIWAVYRDTIIKHIDRPKLDVKFYETDAPYLRHIPPDQQTPFHHHVLTLSIINDGRSVAKSCQPLITKVWLKDKKERLTPKEEWVTPTGWVPLPLNWVFVSKAKVARNIVVIDQVVRQLNEEEVYEIDIVPHRPYLFNICTFLEDNRLKLTAPNKSRSQPWLFYGEMTYCIEVTVFSVNAKTTNKCFYIEWKEPFNVDLSLFEKNINIYESKDPPKLFRCEEIEDALPSFPSDKTPFLG